MKNYIYVALFALFFTCVGLGWLNYKKDVIIENKSDQLKAATDTVTLYKTKDGKNGAYIRVLEGTKKEVLAITKMQDQRIYDLIKETKGLRNYTNHGVETRVDTTVRTDTVRLPSANKPLYAKTHIDNEYYTAEVELIGDSTKLIVVTFNEFDYLQHDKPAKGLFGFLKPDTYIIEAINLNPKTVTKNLRTIQIRPKERTGLKIGIGVAAGIAAVLLLK